MHPQPALDEPTHIHIERPSRALQAESHHVAEPDRGRTRADSPVPPANASDEPALS
jgi:hypothetical protein